MRYLKKFNEELRPGTYRSAARKLSKLGHGDRASQLQDWSEKIEAKEELIKWKDRLQDYALFGKFKITIKNLKTSEKFTADYYLDITFDDLVFSDSFDYEKEQNPDNITGVSLPFFIGIIPTDQETLEKCKAIMPSPDFGNGMFWAMCFGINFEIKGHKLTLLNCDLDNYDTSLSGHVSFADRASAGRFKMLMKSIFTNPKLNYPSGYTDVEWLWEKLEQVISVRADFETEYGVALEDIGQFISGISANELYKPL